MRLIAILGTLGVVAALVSGCALDTGENGPAPAVEQTGKEEQAFDASMFKFSPYLLDDHRGAAGGSQRAMAALHFVDTRKSWINPDVWDCRIVIEMPIRHHSLGVIAPDHAAQMSAGAADAASTVVMHSQPRWMAALFCPKLAGQIMRELNSLNLGSRVFSM